MAERDVQHAGSIHPPEFQRRAPPVSWWRSPQGQGLMSRLWPQSARWSLTRTHPEPSSPATFCFANSLGKPSLWQPHAGAWLAAQL